MNPLSSWSLQRKLLAILCVGVLFGVFLGGLVFSSVQPRSLLAWRTCEQASCLRTNELTGLVAAVGLKFAAGAIPLVVQETPYSLVLRHPLPEARVHYIIIPKKDIKNIGELSDQDQAYLLDAFALMQEIIKREHLTKYIVKTNGPGYQDVAYLHFHLMAE
ncbi:HIT domain-containing protein [Patescibacteria group bacterium]|nr:HIT domain-containing protein [Patescibacteria group bacterium]